MKKPLQELHHAEQLDFAPPEQLAHIAILRAADRLQADFLHLFKGYDLSPAQYNVLRILRGAGPKGLPTQKVSQRLITRVPDVTRLVDRLIKSGLVERVRCEEDRRVVYVTLTKDGHERLEELDEPVLKLHQKQLGHIPEAKLIQLLRIIEEVISP